MNNQPTTAEHKNASDQEQLNVIIAANTVDALRDVTDEQKREIIILWSEIFRAAEAVDRFNRGILIDQAMEDSGFDFEQATKAGRSLLDGLNQQIQALERHRVRAKERGDLLTKYLNPVAMASQNMAECYAREIELIKRRITSAGDDRQAAFEKLVEMGVPADVAKQSAKPTQADISELESELAAAQKELEGHQAVTKSLSLQAKRAFA